MKRTLLKRTLLALVLFVVISGAGAETTKFSVTGLPFGSAAGGTISPISHYQFNAEGLIKEEDIAKNNMFFDFDAKAKAGGYYSKYANNLYVGVSMKTTPGTKAVRISSDYPHIKFIKYSIDGAGWNVELNRIPILGGKEADFTGVSDIELPQDGQAHELHLLIIKGVLPIHIRAIDGDAAPIDWIGKNKTEIIKQDVDLSGFENGFILRKKDSSSPQLSDIDKEGEVRFLDDIYNNERHSGELLKIIINEDDNKNKKMIIDFGLVVKSPGVVRIASGNANGGGEVKFFTPSNLPENKFRAVRGESVFNQYPSINYGDFYAEKAGIYPIRISLSANQQSGLNLFYVKMPYDEKLRPITREETVIRKNPNAQAFYKTFHSTYKETPLDAKATNPLPAVVQAPTAPAEVNAAYIGKFPFELVKTIGLQAEKISGVEIVTPANSQQIKEVLP